MSGPVTRSRLASGVELICLERPQAMNALTREMRQMLTCAFRDLAGDSTCTVIVLTGAGRAFCAGLDLKELAGDSALLVSDDDIDFIAAMLACPQPLIAYVNGPAITGGFELALACDFRIGNADARFRDSHAEIGALPGWGLSQRLSRMVGIGRAMEASLTRRMIGAEEAMEWGLLNRIVDSETGLDDAIAVAKDIASAVPGLPARLKRLIGKGYELPFHDALAWEIEESSRFNRDVESHDLADRREGVMRAGRSASSP